MPFADFSSVSRDARLLSRVVAICPFQVAPGALVERCDMCCRFASDEEAKARLRELGIA